MTDAQVEAACATLKRAIEAAENSNQAGEDFVMAAAAGPALLEALDAAYRFISQPQRMDTPAGGPKIATYRTEGYNELTGKLRAAIRKATGREA